MGNCCTTPDGEFATVTVIKNKIPKSAKKRIFLFAQIPIIGIFTKK